MLLNGGRDQFEVAKVLHLPDGCFERVCGFVGDHLNKFGADAELERIALSGFKPVAEAKFNSADRDLFIRQRRAGEKVHGRGADKIAHKGGGGPLAKWGCLALLFISTCALTKGLGKALKGHRTSKAAEDWSCLRFLAFALCENDCGP